MTSPARRGGGISGAGQCVGVFCSPLLAGEGDRLKEVEGWILFAIVSIEAPRPANSEFRASF